MIRTRALFLAAAAVTTLAAPAIAQRNFDNVEVKTEEVAPGIAVLFGAGGNIGVSHGDDATAIIDDQFAPLSGKIEAAIEGLGAKPVKYVINTHWHFDHTGGNEHFGKTGATIFAHDNVRVRMTAGGTAAGTETPAAPKAALPVVTFERGVTMHLNGDTIDVIFLGGGHTDGDSIVRWREKNVVHMGDLYFKIAGWPFVDTNSGGDVEHLLFSIDSAISMMDGDTKVIPGHGPMSNRAELIAYRNVVGEAVTLIKALKNTGSSLEEALAAKPLDSFERGEGFISADAFTTAVWNSLD